MKAFLIFCLFLIGAVTQKQLSLPVDPSSQKRLSMTLKSLGQELQTFRTPAQSPNSLYKKVSNAAINIQKIRKQIGHRNNVVVGEGNYVTGSRNILIGNYDSIRGSNNFILVEGFDGSANGALLIEKWKIILNKMQSIKVNPSQAISLINEEQNRKYQKYLSKNGVFNFGSNLNKNSVILLQDQNDQMSNQIATSLATLPRPQSANLFESTSTAINLPQNGVRQFGGQNFIGQPKQQNHFGGRLNSILNQPFDSQSQQSQQFTARIKINDPIQTRNLQVQNLLPKRYRTYNTKSYTDSSSRSVNSRHQAMQIFQDLNLVPREASNNNVLSYAKTVSMTNFGQSLSNAALNEAVSDVKKNAAVEIVTSSSNNVKKSPLKVQSQLIKNGNKKEQQVFSKFPSLLSNLRAEQLATRETLNVLNAQMQKNLNSRYARTTEAFRPQNNPIFTQRYPSVENYVFQKMGPLYGQYRRSF